MLPFPDKAVVLGIWKARRGGVVGTPVQQWPTAFQDVQDISHFHRQFYLQPYLQKGLEKIHFASVFGSGVIQKFQPQPNRL